MFCCVPVGPEPELPLRCLRPVREGGISCADHRRCVPHFEVDGAAEEALVEFATRGDVPHFFEATQDDQVYGLTRTAELLASVRRLEKPIPEDGVPGFVKDLARAAAKGGREFSHVPQIVTDYVFQRFGEKQAPPAEKVMEFVFLHPLSRVSLALLTYAESPCNCIDRAFARDLQKDFDAVLTGRFQTACDSALCRGCVEGIGIPAAGTLGTRDALQWMRERFPISPSFQNSVTWA